MKPLKIAMQVMLASAVLSLVGLGVKGFLDDFSKDSCGRIKMGPQVMCLKDMV
jgi:hypothetical protein